jgi:MFS family permease
LFIGIAFAIHRRLGKNETRLKKSQIAYFVVTGFSYMCMEIGLIGKYDLFLGNPLYSMALITAVFLLANGLGSLWVDRLSKRFPLEFMAGAALATTLFTIVTAETIIPHFIGLGLAAKIPLVLVLILPVGVALGMFFPYAVGMKKDEPTFNVSSAYGFSVLSSVLGGAYALAVMMNIGYRNLLLHSAVGYVLLLAGIFVSHRLLKNKVF